MTVTSIDTHPKTNITFIASMEAKNYSIFASMYHVEYQLLNDQWDYEERRDTEEIAYRLSLMLNKVARSNTNRILGSEHYFFKDFGVARVWAHDFPIMNNRRLL